NAEVISVPLVWLLDADDDSSCFCRDHKILEKKKSHESTNERQAMGNAGVCRFAPCFGYRPGYRLCPRTGQDKLYEVGHHGTIYVDHGPHEGGETGDREAASRSPWRALRPQRPAGGWCHDGAWQGAARRHSRQAARSNDLGEAGIDEPRGNPREESVPKGILPAAASQPSRRRNAFSAL